MGPKHKTKATTKQTVEGLVYSDAFSPIKILESPTQNRQGNLTGSARKLKDGAADLHNLLQKWSNLNVKGTNIVNEIANIKLEKILGQSEESEQVQDILPKSLLPLCEKLENLLQNLEKVSCRLSGLVQMSNGVAQLERYNRPDQAEIVIFQTWDINRFETVYREVAEMYEKELKLKQCICENICHGTERDVIMFYTAAWVHEPYLESNMKLLLESMLLETRHKT